MKKDNLNGWSLFEYLEETLMERNVTVIDDNDDDCILARNDADGRVLFIYAVSYEFEAIFEFDLLSHVSERYAKNFQLLLKRNGYKLETVETVNDYYEKLVKK